jgi:hypothetical protein
MLTIVPLRAPSLCSGHRAPARREAYLTPLT